MSDDADRKGNPPIVQIVLGILTLLGILGTSYIAGGWQYGNWGKTNANANAAVDTSATPLRNADSGASSVAMPELVTIRTPKNDVSVEATRQRDGSALFPVETNIAESLPANHPNAVVLILIKQGDAWWAQDHKKADSGKMDFEAWSGGGGNEAKENEPLKIRAIVLDSVKPPNPGTRVQGGQEAKELAPIALSKVVDFKISRIHRN